MDTKRQLLRALLVKHMDATDTPAEAEQLTALMAEFSEEEITDTLMTIIPDEKYEDKEPHKQEELQAGWLSILKTHPAVPPHKVPVRRVVWFWYAAAFLLAVLTGAAIWLLRDKPFNPATDICELVQPSEKAIKKDQLVKWNIDNGVHTISISPGWQYETLLPDGSKAILNTGSSVSYRGGFNDGKREVKIEGEVFFNVAANANDPFYVTARGTRIEVLGTSFNVNAYADSDSVYTTLVSGSLRTINGNSNRLLKPGERAITGAQPNTGIRVDSADVEKLKLSREGYFSFRGSDVKDVVQELARWYKWKVEFRNYAKHKKFTSTFCRKTGEKDVLKTLQEAGINITKAGNRIIITQ